MAVVVAATAASSARVPPAAQWEDTGVDTPAADVTVTAVADMTVVRTAAMAAAMAVALVGVPEKVAAVMVMEVAARRAVAVGLEAAGASAAGASAVGSMAAVASVVVAMAAVVWAVVGLELET